jgi:nicotinate-nucleotide adenylyltransferase
MTPTPDQGGRWGILGGTFDPVHLGHLTLASDMCQRKNLTGVFFVPSVKHPFKQGKCQASFSDRTAMLRLAVEGYDNFFVSEIEDEAGLSGYTLDTVRSVKQMYPESEFYFIVGADLLNELNDWHNPTQLLKEVKMLVGARLGQGNNAPDSFPSDRIELVETSLVNVSSTDIRRRIKENVPVVELDKLLPPKVRLYIQQRKLYV